MELVLQRLSSIYVRTTNATSKLAPPGVVNSQRLVSADHWLSSALNVDSRRLLSAEGGHVGVVAVQAPRRARVCALRSRLLHFAADIHTEASTTWWIIISYDLSVNFSLHRPSFCLKNCVRYENLSGIGYIYVLWQRLIFAFTHTTGKLAKRSSFVHLLQIRLLKNILIYRNLVK